MVGAQLGYGRIDMSLMVCMKLLQLQDEASTADVQRLQATEANVKLVSDLIFSHWQSAWRGILVIDL
jgi:hypothetical protein